MLRRVQILALILSLSTACLANTLPSNRDEREVLRTEQRWNEALLRKDRALLDRLMAPEFTISDSDGHVRSKSEVLDALAAPDLRFERHQQGNIHISSYGNFAVATGTYLVRVRYGDQVLDKSGRYTRVYVRRAGRWQTLREQSSPFDDDDGLI
jgi:hypothetical protein